MTTAQLMQLVVTGGLLVWYFSVKANRECFFAMMLVGLPIAVLAWLADWLSGWTLI